MSSATPVPRSLVWATGLDVLPPNRVIERRQGYLLVRSPGNPTHDWGNLVLDYEEFADDPRVEAARRASAEHGATRFVIEADAGYHALGLHESLGFERAEDVVGAVCGRTTGGV